MPLGPQEDGYPPTFSDGPLLDNLEVVSDRLSPTVDDLIRYITSLRWGKSHQFSRVKDGGIDIARLLLYGCPAREFFPELLTKL